MRFLKIHKIIVYLLKAELSLSKSFHGGFQYFCMLTTDNEIQTEKIEEQQMEQSFPNQSVKEILV